jgi:hypothetical protein
MHTHLVVAAAEVKLREENNVFQLVQELFCYRNGELVSYCLAFQRPVVDAEPPRVIRLANRRTGAENGDVLARMMPCSSIAWH